MGPGNDLRICGDDAFDQNSVFRGTCSPYASESTEIVHALQKDDVTDAGLRQDIAVKTRQSVGTEAIGQQMITSDPLIQDADIMKPGRVESAR